MLENLIDNVTSGIVDAPCDKGYDACNTYVALEEGLLHLYLSKVMKYSDLFRKSRTYLSTATGCRNKFWSRKYIIYNLSDLSMCHGSH